MEANNPERLRDTVYVIGAGFSAGLGYPLTKSLLIDVWSRLNEDSRDQLRRIIAFHHPAFTAKRKTSFPDIEQLLTEIAVKGGVKLDHWGGEKLDHFIGGSGCGLKDLRGRLERRPATRFAGSV